MRSALPAWIALLATIPFLAAFYLLLPANGPERTIAYPAAGLIAVAAILIGVHRRKPARAGPWRLVALALALMSAGDITWSVLALGGAEVPYPSLADFIYLPAYLGLIVGTVGLMRGRMAVGDRTSYIDAAILSAGAGSIFWVAIVEPSLTGATDPLAVVVSMSYPVLDLVLLTLGIRLVLSGAARPLYLQILIAGIALYFVADVIYSGTVLNGVYAQFQMIDAGWIVGVLLVGVAALHPSVTEAETTIEPKEASLGRARLGLLAGAAVIAPAILLVQEAQIGDIMTIGLLVEWTLLFALVLVRLAMTVDALAVSLGIRRLLQADLAHQARHDPLTRLANRLLFEERLGRAMATAPERTALVFLDLDDFKAINDTLGHPTGDELLQVVAGRLQHGLRRTDLAARLGGDEFAMIIEQCDDAAGARSAAERALASLRRPVDLSGRQLLIHASAGVAMGFAGSTATDLMRDADVAMYQAKSHGKDQVEVYEAVMHGQVVRSYALRTEMAAAIESNAFVLHYQAALNLVTGAVLGAEALVRWNHPQRGLIGPNEFIPEAETSGLIHPLGRWILREACATAATWPDQIDGQRPSVSVNLAASQLLQPSLVDDVAAILAETGLPPANLTLEVTESALVDLVPAREALLRLRGLGVVLALDDFGTGYSALSYLAELPFSIIKIDQSFVASIGQGSRVDALLAGIVGLCRSLDLLTIAEGIEQKHQLDFLVGLGCVVGQGYLLARPAPSAQFVSMLTDQQRERQHADGLRRRLLPALTPRVASPASA